MPKSVIRLAVDVSDPVQRRRVEKVFSAAFQLRRAVQCDARQRVDAYWAAHHERRDGPAAVRKRLGLSKKGVWEATRRHLFADAAGRRQGKPRITGWWEFRRIPGRARSHTKPKKWETFRLHGTVAATRAAMTGGGWRRHRPIPTPAARPWIRPGGTTTAR
jgi:hypothetical protein